MAEAVPVGVCTLEEPRPLAPANNHPKGLCFESPILYLPPFLSGDTVFGPCV